MRRIKIAFSNRSGDKFELITLSGKRPLATKALRNILNKRETENVINTYCCIYDVWRHLQYNEVCQIQEDLVKKLTGFGFTVNQAKVYLSIVQAGSVSVGKIAKVTQLHRQDIYKILPKLEKKGLITKTINKPFMIEAIPVETALNQLVFNEREKESRKIALLEDDLKGLVASLHMQPKNQEEARFSLLTTDDAISNKATLSFKELKKEIKLVTSLELLLSPLTKLNEFIQLLSLRKANTLMLVATLEKKEVVRKTIEKLAPKKIYVTVKLIGRNICKHYMIIDHKEVWIATEQRTESGFPCILYTNDRNIVHVYEEYFDKGWNHSGAITIYPQRNFQTRKLIAT